MRGVSTSTSIMKGEDGKGLPLEEALDGIAAAGFEQIELSRRHKDLDDVVPKVSRSGLRVWSVHGTLGGQAISSSETERRQAVEQACRHLDIAAAFAPCPYVIHYLNRVHDPAAGVAFRKSVAELHEVAAPLGITLAVETAPDKVSNERFPDSVELTAFVRSFDSPLVGVCLDVNHANLGEDLGAVIEHCRGLIANIHVSDNHGVTEDHLLPGEGSIDLPAAMLAIHQAGYAGPLNLECRYPGTPPKEVLVGMRRWAEAVLKSIHAA